MRQDRHVVWAGALCLATVLATVLYYRGMPGVELDPDTPAYLNVAHQIASQGVFVDPARLPGYPVVVCIIFWLISLSAQSSEAIILRHPIEYLGDSFSLMWASLAADQPYRPLPHNAWSSLWGWTASAIQHALVAFPVAACLWWALLLSLPGFRKRRRPHIIQAVAASRINIAALAVVALLAAYGLAVTTLGGYIMYERLHTPFDPLLIVVIWATLIALWSLARQYFTRRTHPAAPAPLPSEATGTRA